MTDPEAQTADTDPDPRRTDRRQTDPRPTDPRPTDPRPTHPVPRRVPRWGSVAHRRIWGIRLSTALGGAARGGATQKAAPQRAAPQGPAPQRAAPQRAAPQEAAPRRAAPRTAATPGAGWVVVVGGIAFLLARPTLRGSAVALSLLAVGYLAVGAAALAVPATQGDRGARPPLGWAVPLGLGLVGVAGAAVVAGPVADRRVGTVGAGLALAAAVVEEALFRRVLYDRLLRFGVVLAVIGSAVVFALVHLPAYGVAAMPVDLGAALLLSWQRYASGRWTVPAVTHAVANLLAVT
jgi:membrane protease YdiL (CAAX protease family)